MQKWYIDDEEVSEEDFDSQLENETNDEIDDDYVDQYISDAWGDEVEIAGYSFNTAYALRELDSDRYYDIQTDLQANQLSDNRYEVEHGSGVTVGGYTFEIRDEDDEDEEEVSAIDWFDEDAEEVETEDDEDESV